MVELGLVAPQLVQPTWAEHVTAPAVDAVGPEQLTALAQREPWSFLHVTGSDAAGPPSDDPAGDAAAHLQRLRAAGAFAAMPRPGVVVYRIGASVQAPLGVVGDLDLADCAAGRLRRHEHTDPAKVAALEHQRAKLGVDTTPISVAYRDPGGLQERLAQLTATAPAVSATTADGARHDLWPVTDPAALEEITDLFAALEAVYVLDGHHRLAAAVRHADAVAADSGTPGDAGRILTALFPAEQVQLLDYRRVVRRPPHQSAQALLDAVAQRFTVTTVDGPQQAEPGRRGEMGLRLDGQWYRLHARAHICPQRLPNRLDEAVVQRHLLHDVLGAGPGGDESALSHVPGTVPLSELDARLAPHDIVLALHALPMAELQAVADAGAVLPPKSTYVTPKVAAGLLLQRRTARVPAVL
jgi:uncharacterized protein (DUF1015 family)